MRCPFCNTENTAVKDSRPAEEGSAVRRRRQCEVCGGRFTTFERVQLREISVLKRNGNRVPFDRDKLLRSIRIALRRRPVDDEHIEQLVSGMVRRLESNHTSEVESSAIGEMVMTSLKDIDPVGYVRYASVYRDFRDPKDFAKFIEVSDLEDDDP